MLTCHKATHLMSARLDRPLPLSEKLSLTFHLMMCKSCHRCDQQLELIHQAGQGWHQKRFEEGHIEPDSDASKK